MGSHGRQKCKDYKGLGVTQTETETGGDPYTGGTVFEKLVVG